MDLAELNRLLAEEGLPPRSFGFDETRWLSLEPTRIVYRGDRGHDTVVDYADEDDLCRHLLADELGRRAPRPGARLHPAAPSETEPAGLGLHTRWRRRGSRVVVAGRGHGQLVLRDSDPLMRHPDDGAAQLLVLDAATGTLLDDELALESAGSVVVAGDPPQVLQCAPGRLVSSAGWGTVRSDGEEPVAEAADADGSAAVLLQRRDGATRLVSLVDGRERWRGQLADLTYTAWGLPRRTRAVRIDPDPDRLIVEVIDLTDGTVRCRLVDEPLPPTWQGARRLVVVDALDEDGAEGAVGVRFSLMEPGVGQRMGDVVVSADAMRFVVDQPIGPGLAPRERAAMFAGDAWGVDRLMMSARDPAQPSRLETGEGTVLWERPTGGRVEGRVDQVSVVRFGDHVEAIADDGTTVWSSTARLLGLAGEGQQEAWLQDADAVVTAVDVRTGHVLRSAPAPWPQPPTLRTPRGVTGWHADDGVVVAEQDGGMVAYGWT